MRHPVVVLVLLVCCASCTFASREEPELVWEDTFSADDLDSDIWTIQRGDGCDQGLCGWGNEEMQWYQEENIAVEDGDLVITARREPSHGYGFTSARIMTHGRVDVKYGRIEARMKLPKGEGYWPAFWMMPTDSVYGGWAASGELDIMESKNDMRTIHGTIHFGGEWPNNDYATATLDAPEGTDWAGDYHVFGIDWRPGRIDWLVDGKPYASQTAWSTTEAPFPAPFDQPFYIIFNLAVGGRFTGTSPAPETPFPQAMRVDWVRVYAYQE